MNRYAISPQNVRLGHALHEKGQYLLPRLIEVKREKQGSHTVISVCIAKVGGKKVKPKTPVFDIDDDDEYDIPF